jgi:hypothetical protein
MLGNSPGMRCSSFRVPGRVAAALLVFGAAVNIAGAQTVSFQTPLNLPGARPEAIAIGNFKGDNVLDLAVANGDSNSVSVFLGNADGTFLEPVDYAVGSQPWFLTAADLNGDKFLDLVVSNENSGNLTVLLGVGDGTFVYGGTITLDATPFSVAVGDFNLDGFPDLAVTDTFNAYLLFGNGDGTFGPAQVLMGPHARFISTADFNGDNIPDLAVSNGHGVDNITILLGNGDGTFQQAGNYAVG